MIVRGAVGVEEADPEEERLAKSVCLLWLAVLASMSPSPKEVAARASCTPGSFLMTTVY